MKEQNKTKNYNMKEGNERDTGKIFITCMIDRVNFHYT